MPRHRPLPHWLYRERYNFLIRTTSANPEPNPQWGRVDKPLMSSVTGPTGHQILKGLITFRILIYLFVPPFFPNVSSRSHKSFTHHPYVCKLRKIDVRFVFLFYALTFQKSIIKVYTCYRKLRNSVHICNGDVVILFFQRWELFKQMYSIVL